MQGLKDQALAEPDKDEVLKWEKGVVRGKVFVPKVEEVITKEYDSDDEEPVKVESTSDTHLWLAKSPTYVNTMLAACGSRFVAAATFVLVMVLAGEPYCRPVILPIQ